MPYTESLRLAAARPEDTRVVLVRLLEPVELGRGRAWLAAARELAALALVVHGLRPD